MKYVPRISSKSITFQSGMYIFWRCYWNLFFLIKVLSFWRIVFTNTSASQLGSEVENWNWTFSGCLVNLLTALLPIKWRFKVREIKHSSSHVLGNMVSSFCKSAGTKTHHPLSPCWALFVLATINVYGMICEINIS